MKPAYPTPLHEACAHLAIRFFQNCCQVDAILLLNSCARGKAVPESDLDIGVLVAPDTTLYEKIDIEQKWRRHVEDLPVYQQFRQWHPFAHIHLDILDGKYSPGVWDDGGGPDTYEIEIGNHLVYSSLIHGEGVYLKELRDQFLPYYGEALRQKRLEMVRKACEYDLDHIPFYIKRKQFFQAFDRLYKAFQEFLQALFIDRKTYPIAYNKWIREQMETCLQEPQLYHELLPILQVRSIEGGSILRNARMLKRLEEKYLHAVPV